MSHYKTKFTAEHFVGDYGYKIVKISNDKYSLFYLSKGREIEYDDFSSLDDALEAAYGILENIKSGV